MGNWKKSVQTINLQLEQKTQIEAQLQKYCFYFFIFFYKQFKIQATPNLSYGFNFFFFKFFNLLSARLDSAFFAESCGAFSDSFFIFYFFLIFQPYYLTKSTMNSIRALFTDPQISLFNNFFIKNGSHDTIHTFKNYFVTVFSVSFSKNKLNPNGP